MKSITRLIRVYLSLSTILVSRALFMHNICISCTFGESILSPNEYIARNTKIHCTKEHLQIEVSFESLNLIAKQLTGHSNLTVEVSLNECFFSRVNDRFEYKSTDKSSCGTHVSEVNGNSVYDNQLMLWYQNNKTPSMVKPLPHSTPSLVDRSDSENIRHVAKKSSMLFPLTFTCFENSRVDYVLHKLVLFSNSNFTKSVDSYTLQVHVNDHIFVEARTSSFRDIGVIVDKCWLSNSSASITEGNHRFSLIENGCPADLTVGIYGSGKGHQRFSFQVNEDFENKSIFLHCKLTSCLSKERRKADDQPYKLCHELNRTCNFQAHFQKQKPTRFFSIEPYGPIIVLPKIRTSVVPSSIVSPVTTDGDQHLKSTTTKVMPNQRTQSEFGLTTLPVVLIATSSFLMGATLVSILWYIHWRTDPSKPHRTHRGQQSSHSSSSSSNHESHVNQKTAQLSFGFDFSSNSAESSPSSQRRMPLNSSSNAVH